jgi:hypothetical protein
MKHCDRDLGLAAVAAQTPPTAAFLCGVVVLRAKHDAGRSMLLVQL